MPITKPYVSNTTIVGTPNLVVDNIPISFENVEIVFYRNKAEHNRVDKTNYITEQFRVKGSFREQFSVTELSIKIYREQLFDCNYAYIPILNRYYFVTDYTSVSDGLWEIELDIDVLMSYRLGILNLKAFIDRNEFKCKEDIIDTKRAIEQGQEIQEYNIPNELFGNTPNASTQHFIVSGFALGIVGQK